jgi:hypothetical protein
VRVFGGCGAVEGDPESGETETAMVFSLIPDAVKVMPHEVNPKLREGPPGRAEKYLAGSLLLQSAVQASICKTVTADYARHVRQLGGHGPEVFREFLDREYEKPKQPEENRDTKDRRFRYATGTVRNFKAACIHHACLAGMPWTRGDSRLCEMVLTGYEATNA